MKYALIMHLIGFGWMEAPLERQLSYPMCLMRMSEGVGAWHHMFAIHKPEFQPTRDNARIMCVVEPAWRLPRSDDFLVASARPLLN